MDPDIGKGICWTLLARKVSLYDTRAYSKNELSSVATFHDDEPRDRSVTGRGRTEHSCANSVYIHFYTSFREKKRKDGTTLSKQSPQAVDLRLSMIKEINFEDFVHRYKLDESPDNDRISAHEMRSK